jgi:hypothetical protein
MTTLISHIYNEEFLLPFFIAQHYKKFEQGIILDYGSTDGSLRILKELAPNWSIIDCSEEEFDALKLDALIHSIEEKISGVCLVLTTTEFFIGDPRFITAGMVLPSYSLLRKQGEPEIQANQKFHEVYKTGISPFLEVTEENAGKFTRLMGRKIRTSREKYPIGRHFEVLGHAPFLIYRVANCLAADEMIRRRLQIQNKIPLNDIKLGLGVQHTNYGKGLDTKALVETVESEMLLSEDLSGVISSALEIESKFLSLETDSEDFNFMKKLILEFELNQRLIQKSLDEKLGCESEKIAAQYELEKLRKDYEDVSQENQSLRELAGRSSTFDKSLKEAEHQLLMITEICSESQRQLLGEIKFLKDQSRRPSYNLSLLISNVLPAIKFRFRKLFK